MQAQDSQKQENQNFDFDWSDMAFGSKKPIRELKALFIAAPRQMSLARFKQLVKTYLPQGNIVLGLSKEPFVEGFEGQPQFRTLTEKTVKDIIAQVNKSASPNKIYTVKYFQRELPFLLEKLGFKKIVLVRGSWRNVFHSSPSYYALAQKGVPFEMVSPFANEKEARDFAAKTAVSDEQWIEDHLHENFSEKGMFELAATAAKLSYDYSFQTGAALGKKIPSKSTPKQERYKALIASCNQVVPFSTYAMHYGNSREDHLSPPNDLNYYDTVHAEVSLILLALRHKIDLAGTTLFINLMPCPTCARMLSQTDIAEFVYSIDHSEGYAVKMLEAAGKKVRRVVL